MINFVYNKKILYLVVLLIFIQAGLFFILIKSEYKKDFSVDSVGLEQTKEDQSLAIHYSYFSKKDFFDDAYSDRDAQKVNIDSKIYGGIVPHHLLVKEKISTFFQGIKNEYDTIVLIGPDHFSNGQRNVSISSAIWKTPYGTIKPDINLVNSLVQDSDFIVNEPPFIAEHSISGLVSFIRKSLPRSKIVPIILKNNTSKKDCIKLAKIISDKVNKEKVLVLASVDFSHYMPTDVANFHDVKSNGVIKNFDFSRIFDLEIDSPASIYTLLKYLEFENIKKSELLFSTNSGVLTGKESEATTSHNFYYFLDGEKKENNVISTLFFGDLMLDRHVGDRIKKNGLSNLFSEISGEEDRFFMGLDIVSANLEGAVTNNGNHYDPIMSYDFAFSPDLIQELVQKYNFNFFNLSNNHFFDQGERGIIETRENLDNIGVNYSGCRDKRVDECSYKIVEVNNKKIGMLGFSTVYGLVDMSSVENLVKELREEVNIIIVNIHWGIEYEHEFNSVQQSVAHRLVDSGADIIIGHHPHVVQGMEIYKSKPIFYSLGNFIFDQYFSNDTQEGLSVGVNFINSDIEISLFPFISKASQPRLMNDNEKDVFYKKFISWSYNINGIEKDQIKGGVIIVE